MMEKDSHAVALAALSVAMHNTRILANRGLLSPNEVETIYSAMLEPLEALGSPQLQANVSANLEPVLAEIRQWAQQLWVGKGKTDPK